MLRVLTLVAASAVLIAAGGVNAATITWGLATDTTGASVVSTTGSLVRAFDSGGPATTVNGVPFAAFGGAGDDVAAALGNSFGGADGGADLGSLDDLLRTTNYLDLPKGSPATTITITGLAVGTPYELQLFFMEQRGPTSAPPCGGCNDRTVTFTSGPNSVTLEADPGNTLGAPFGQYAIGAFTADATTQGFDVTGIGFLDSGEERALRQINAWQLRVVPEPSSFALLAIGVSLLAWRRRSVKN